jgi:hypothetical protein
MARKDAAIALDEQDRRRGEYFAQKARIPVVVGREYLNVFRARRLQLVLRLPEQSGIADHRGSLFGQAAKPHQVRGLLPEHGIGAGKTVHQGLDAHGAQAFNGIEDNPG